jgi:hypothetical protein
MEIMEPNNLLQLAILAVALVVVWVLLRFMFKLTVTLFRIGCAIIAIIMVIAFAATLLGS